MPAVAIPLAGGWWINRHLSSHNGATRILSFKNLDEAMAETERLQQASKVTLESEWTLYQNIIHCAQSIEFSISGFPEEKPEIFQRVIGKNVFRKFEMQGYMRHDRNEPIPGAPIIEPGGKIIEAFDRVKMAIRNFDAFTGKLRRHFAYGILNKKEFSEAHCMHLADHYAIMNYPPA